MEPVLSILGALFTDTLKSAGKALTSDKFKQLRARFAQLKPDAGQAVQRAVYTAYWQAVLHVMHARARVLNINIEAMLAGDDFKEFFAELCQLGQYALDASLPSPMPSRTSWQRVFNVASASNQLLLPPAPDEREWLPRAIRRVWGHLAIIRTSEAAMPELPAGNELERLLARPFTHDDAREIELRAALLNRVSADIEKLCGDLPGEALIEALQSDWHNYFRAALHAALNHDQAVANAHQNQQLAEILCRLQDNALTPDALRAMLALNNTALIQRLEDVAEGLRQRDYAAEAQIWLAPLFAAAQNLEQAFAALPLVMREGFDEMRERFDGLEAKLGGTPNAPSVPRAAQLAYLRWLQNKIVRNADICYTPLGGGVEAIRQPMEQIFELYQPNRVKQPAVTRFPDAIPVIRKRRRVVLLGDPGGGKTTTLGKLAAELAAAAVQDEEAPLPLFIHLGFWTAPAQPLRDFIAEQLCNYDPDSDEDGDLGVYLDVLLAQKRAALLLDSLNELPVEQRLHKYPLVRQFIAECSRHNSKLLAVVSCRELDYKEAELGFDKLTVAPLDYVQVRRFVKGYLDEASGEALFWKLAGETTHEYHSDFIAKVGAQHEQDFWRGSELPADTNWSYEHEWGNEDNRWLYWLKQRAKPSSQMQLASNPLLLSMLTAEFSRNDNALPDNRGELFRQFVEGLLQRERERNLITADECDQVIGGLCKVAFAMQTRLDDKGKARTALPKTEVKTLLGARLLYLAHNVTLLKLGEQVRFSHQLFQEYFAAKYMYDKFCAGGWRADEIWPRDAWWKSTNWEEATILFAGLYEDCTPVVNWLADAQPELAARCINESGAVLAKATCEATLEQLREKWLPRLTDVHSDPEPQARAAIGRALGQLNLDNRENVTGVTRDGLPSIDWVEIHGGEFQYGAEKQADDPDWYTPAKPQRLTLPTFWMSRFPVTNAQFQTFLDDPKGYADARWFAGLAADEDERRIEEPGFNFPNHPRETVNWYQALAFCRWLSWRMGGGFDLKRVDKWAVRLPTEVEWERAARGVTGLIYPYGNEFKAEQGNVGETGIGKTSAVGIFPDGKSPDGVLDMSGNVWEWCLSEYRKPEVKPQLDARKEKLNTDTNRVLRGGAWFYDNDFVRAVFRYYYSPGLRHGDSGFRLVVARPPS